MHTFVIIVHYFVCIFLILIILLQTGKGADIGAAFGGASQTVFGSRGPATFLNKLTVAVALFFLFTSIFLAHQAKNVSVKSVVDEGTPPAAGEVLPAEEAPTEEETAPSEGANEGLKEGQKNKVE